MSKAVPLDHLSRAGSAYDQNNSDYFYHIFVVLRRGIAMPVCHPLCLILKI